MATNLSLLSPLGEMDGRLGQVDPLNGHRKVPLEVHIQLSNCSKNLP